MNSEWKLTKLSDLGEFDRGKSKHRPRDAAHLYGGPYPFIQTGDITSADGRITSYRQTYSEEGLAQSRIWPNGTLCITIAANIAETALLTFPACFPDSVVGFTAFPNKSDVRFIEYLFRAFRKTIKNRAYGSVQENINLEVLRNIAFPIPDLKSQIAIADFFSLLDDRIHLFRETNITLESIAQTLFKSWFIDFDPVRAKMKGRQPEGMDAETAALFPDCFEKSELGLIPKGYQIVTIGEMCDFQNGYAFKSNEMDSCSDNVYKIFKMGNIKKGGGLNRLAVKDYLRKDKAGKLDRYLIKKGDLLMCMTDMKDKVALLGHTALMDKSDEFILNQRVGRLRSKFPDRANYPFLYILTNSHYFIKNLRNRANSGVQVNLSTAEINNTKFILPHKNVHAAFDRLVISLQEKIFSSESEIEVLIELRERLLPCLISGQVRLPEFQEKMEKIS